MSLAPAAGRQPAQRPAQARRPPYAQRPIVLVGLMGAGKSTIGRRLAARLRLPFVDSDREIEAAADLSVAEIFERHGEAHFRDGERRVIARLLTAAPLVIATGGGAFLHEETRALILAHATAVWIDAAIEVLADRVARRPGSRPLLAGSEPRVRLAELAAVRNPIYALAPIYIRSEPSPHEATVDAILRELAR